MNNSLSIILPVQDAQHTLARQVEELLDILPELTADFEILIIDDGSQDQTEEIATDLAREYPQIRVLRRSQPMGNAAAVEAGLGRTTGEIVFVAEGELTSTDLRRLWSLRNDGQLVMAKSRIEPKPIDDRLLTRLIAWGDALRQNAGFGGRETSSERRRGGSVQMIRREAIESLTQVSAPASQLTVERDETTSMVRMLGKQMAAAKIPAPPILAPLAPASSLSAGDLMAMR